MFITFKFTINVNEFWMKPFFSYPSPFFFFGGGAKYFVRCRPTVGFHVPLPRNCDNYHTIYNFWSAGKRSVPPPPPQPGGIFRAGGLSGMDFVIGQNGQNNLCMPPKKKQTPYAYVSTSTCWFPYSEIPKAFFDALLSPYRDRSLMPSSHLACDGSTEPVSCPYPPFRAASARPPCGGRRRLWDFRTDSRAPRPLRFGLARSFTNFEKS